MSDNISTRDDDNTLSVRGFPIERSNKMKTNEIRTTEAAVLKKALRKFCKKWRDTDETEFPKAMMTLVQMNKNEATINCGGEWMSFTYTDCLADAILKDEGFKAIMEQNNATAHKERNSFGTMQIRIHYCDEPTQETSSEEETAPAESKADNINEDVEEMVADEEPALNILEASRPNPSWTYLYTDTTSYNIDMDVYKTEKGKIVMVDPDWVFKMFKE